MCGRFVLTSSPDAVRALFGHQDQPNFPPRYNIAPTQPVLVVRREGEARRAALLRWGLIPPWVKDPRTFSLLINARAETVLEKPAFRRAMARRRCLVPADGFYEWARSGSRKRPFFVRPRGADATGHVPAGPLAFAGLWEHWMGPNGEEIETMCIVTTPANPTLAALHDRMPAVIPPAAFDAWLDCDATDATVAATLLVPAPDSLLETYEVSSAVNRAANDSADLTVPADPTSAPEARLPRSRARDDGPGGQSSLF